MLDLRTIEVCDLYSLIRIMGTFAVQNAFFQDQYALLMRLLAQRYEIREMSEYKDEHLLDAMEKLKTALDALDEYPKDHPGKLFLQYSFTAAAGELENRRRRSMLRAVH